PNARKALIAPVTPIARCRRAALFACRWLPLGLWRVVMSLPSKVTFAAIGEPREFCAELLAAQKVIPEKHLRNSKIRNLSAKFAAGTATTAGRPRSTLVGAAGELIIGAGAIDFTYPLMRPITPVKELKSKIDASVNN
ncbi:MAG TPA: hypothetical protein VFR17_08195, partial [Mycobacterium sp.]|nr:hypothetical protein [Mycobacterium sp.]